MSTIGPITAEHWRFAFRGLEDRLVIDENSPLLQLLRCPPERACSRGNEACRPTTHGLRDGLSFRDPAEARVK